MPRLCAFGCKTHDETRVSSHVFPSYKKFPQQFKAWVTAVGGKLEQPSDYERYKKSVVCHKHFAESDMVRNNRLNRLAVPTLYLNGQPTANPAIQAPFSQSTLAPQHFAFKADTWIDAQLAKTADSINADTFKETGDSIEADTFDIDSPPSPVQDIEATVVAQSVKEQKLFSWQKTELIETDDAGDPISAPVPEKPALREDDVALFCDPGPPSVPCEPAAVVPEDVEYRCKICEAVVDGYHFWCVSCGAGALCGACAATLTHELHFVLRAPTTASKSQMQAVLAALRQQLLAENILTLYEIDENGVKVEVKLESEELPTLPDTTPELEPEPDPLAEAADRLLEIPVVGTSSGPQTVKQLEPTSADTGVQYVGEEKADHHRFKRPRLTEHDQWRPKPESTQKIAGHSLKRLSNIVKHSKTSQMIKVGDLRTLKIVPKHQLRQLNVLKTSSFPSISISKNQLSFTQTLQKLPNKVLTRFQKIDPTRHKVISKTQVVSKGKFCPLKVTSEPVPLQTVVINSRDYVDERMQLLEEEYLVSDSKHEDLLDNDNVMINKTTNKDRIRDIESEINNSDDDDLDKDYRVDEEDLTDDSMYETDENVSNRGVDKRTRNSTETVVRGPWEEMLQKSTLEATVTLQPLTSLEISKWMADKKRRREN